MTNFLDLNAPPPTYSPPVRLSPFWTSQPLDMAAPLAGADAIQMDAKLKHYAALAGQAPGELTEAELADMDWELASNKTVAAIIEADAIRQAGELEVGAARIMQVLVGRAMVSGLHAYHPEKFASVEAMLHNKLDKLQELHPGGSNAGDLTWIIGTFIPLCAMQGVNGYEMLWQENTVAKTRMIADFMRTPLLEAGVTAETLAASDEKPVVVPAALAERVATMVTDAINPLMHKREFGEKHGAQAHPDAAAHPKLQGYHFLMAHGGASLIFWAEAADQSAIELALNADFKLGTATEIERLTEARGQTTRRLPDGAARAHPRPPAGPRPAPSIKRSTKPALKTPPPPPPARLKPAPKPAGKPNGQSKPAAVQARPKNSARKSLR